MKPTKDLQMRGMHEGFHTYGLRWKKDLLEWYYDGELVRTVDDPEYVSRGAGFFILSQGLLEAGGLLKVPSKSMKPNLVFLSNTRSTTSDFGKKLMSVTTLVMPIPATPALIVYLLAAELMTVNHLVDLRSFLSTTTRKDYHSMMPSNIV